MAGILNLYVNRNGEVIKIANSSYNKDKPIKELCLQEVLHVQIMYDTQDRKPYRMLGIWFDRIEIDGLGQYVKLVKDASCLRKADNR